MIEFADQILGKAQLTGFLETICQSLELSDTQFQRAKDHYQAVGEWLSDGDGPLLRGSDIYPQGSISISTTVRPLGRDEYDVDLVCLVSGLTPATSPADLKKAIGDRLHQNGKYSKIIQEKKRCWRLNYAGEFHLDITPTIPNPNCILGGELLPDKGLVEGKLVRWRETNPKGYHRWFSDRAELPPRLRLDEAKFAEIKAKIDVLPEPTKLKGLLRRCVQLCKRHRDIWFANRNADLAPISIIITTLAAKSYEYCTLNQVHDSELDVLLAVVRHMPHFINTYNTGGKKIFMVRNETTREENFADKWNTNARLPEAFYAWQRAVVGDFDRLVSLTGLDQIGKQLSTSFGKKESIFALEKLSNVVSDARSTGHLSVASGLGLSIGAKGGVPVRSNIFYGK